MTITNGYPSGSRGAEPHISDIDLLLFDFDGVMTDNRVWLSGDGTEVVVCSRADGWGLDLLRPTGLKMAIVSTEANPVVRARAAKLKMPVIHGIKDKGDAVRQMVEEAGITLERVGFVGNDTNDMPALRIVGWPMCPLDSHPEVRASARWIINANGGYGVVRLLADTLL